MFPGDNAAMQAVEYLLTKYAPSDDLERRDLESFRLFASQGGKEIYDRIPGRPTITASAVVANPGFAKILVMHHKLHGFYKQFGGHSDGDPNLAHVAEKELFEESGAKGELLLQTPFDIIRWNFPERTKNGIFYPAHDNFDIAFLFRMDEAQKLILNKSEVLDTKWLGLEAWRDYSDMTNPTYAQNPQNLDYQRRIYAKLKQFAKTL